MIIYSTYTFKIYIYIQIQAISSAYFRVTGYQLSMYLFLYLHPNIYTYVYIDASISINAYRLYLQPIFELPDINMNTYMYVYVNI
jgi:hypothetical protein